MPDGQPMKSPKFQFSIDEIRKCVNERSLRRAWKRKLGAQLRRQILIDFVEHKDYTINIGAHCQKLIEEIYSANYHPLKPTHYLIEKSRGLCRQMTLGHPRDMLVLQSLSTALSAEIKNSSPTDKAFFEPGEQKFEEKRLLITGEEYGSVASWKRFQEAIFDFSKERNYIVITDVANFYDFINFTHLRNIIASLCDVKEAVLDFLIFILNEISWNPDFMPRTEIGLPQMELEAPRVLANAMLFELDKVANDHTLGDYVRFMDDIDVGVDTIAQAKRVVRDIDLTLQARQLRLNSSKTKILSTKTVEAESHFCIKENYFLDRVALILEGAPTSAELQTQGKRLRRYYKVWRGAKYCENISETSRFFRGNGEKIFKRIAKLLHVSDQEIDERDLIWLIRQRPSLRSFCFIQLMNKNPANHSLYEVEKIMQNGAFIDDAAYVDFAKFISHAKFYNTQKFRSCIRRIVEFMSRENKYFGNYSTLLIGSKFLTPQENFEHIKASVRYWKSDFWLGRAVGGLMPVISLEPSVHKEYLQMLQKIDNSDALSLYHFHWSVRNEVRVVNQLFEYAKNNNPTYPQKIYHPKALVILSICRNVDAMNQRKAVLEEHPVLRTDPYYRSWNLE